MFTKEYWENRALKYGHTGYGEPFLYCFDQEARKFAINLLLKELSFEEKFKALDFGCGSGDFLQLLKEYFGEINGFDISEEVLKTAKQRSKNLETVFFTNDLRKIKEKAPYDMILSVTVLQGLNPSELASTCELLFGMLSNRGYMMSMEFFGTEARNREYNESRTTDTDWSKILKKNKIRIVSEHLFYNPVLNPVGSWKLYNKNLLIRVLKLFKRFTFVQRILSDKAKHIISKKRDVLGVQNSTFKIYILQKERHAD